jgi:hypothetical protein
MGAADLVNRRSRRLWISPVLARIDGSLLPDKPSPPATLRITRPYGSENEFIEGDFAWVGRTSIVLPNGPARPAGELIRFEVVLSTGAPVFRGEGHVIAHYPPGGGKPPGLEVRFTRIDARSKLVLDRVRERRVGSSRVSEGGAVAQPSASTSTAIAAPPPRVSLPKVPVVAPSERSGVRLASPGRKIAPPPNRDEILARLRVRAQQLAERGGFSFKKRQGSG